MVPESFQVVFEFVFYKILFVIFKFFKLFILPNYENEQVKKNCEMKMDIKVQLQKFVGFIVQVQLLTYLEIHTYVMTHMNNHQRMKK